MNIKFEDDLVNILERATRDSLNFNHCYEYVDLMNKEATLEVVIQRRLFLEEQMRKIKEEMKALKALPDDMVVKHYSIKMMLPVTEESYPLDGEFYEKLVGFGRSVEEYFQTQKMSECVYRAAEQRIARTKEELKLKANDLPKPKIPAWSVRKEALKVLEKRLHAYEVQNRDLHKEADQNRVLLDEFEAMVLDIMNA